MYGEHNSGKYDVRARGEGNVEASEINHQTVHQILSTVTIRIYYNVHILTTKCTADDFQLKTIRMRYLRDSWKVSDRN